MNVGRIEMPGSDGEVITVYGEPRSEALHDAGLLIKSRYQFVRRFVSLSESQAVVVALWVAHTHTIDSADATPYLAITSAEKQSGKTRLLETLAVLVANPWLTGRVTSAVLVRKVDDQKPTLLLDESDAAFGGEKEYAETLRGLLNTGHRRGGVSSLCIGKGAEMSYKDFSTFCPKAIAGIGKLPDTVADRSIPIRLKRAARGEVVERFRQRDVMPEGNALHLKLEQWAASVVQQLRDARPNLPDELSDRQQDGVEPLLAIADVSGSDWPAIARAAVIGLCTEARQSDDSTGIQLLNDIRQAFNSRDLDKIPSAELAEALASIETSPWAEWNKGKSLSAPKLARLLHRFDIAPRKIRIGERTMQGYVRSDLEDAFRRYLPSRSLTPTAETEHTEQTSIYAPIRDFSAPEQTSSVPLTKESKSSVFMEVVPDVPVSPAVKSLQRLLTNRAVEEKV